MGGVDKATDVPLMTQREKVECIFGNGQAIAKLYGPVGITTYGSMYDLKMQGPGSRAPTVLSHDELLKSNRAMFRDIVRMTESLARGEKDLQVVFNPEAVARKALRKIVPVVEFNQALEGEIGPTLFLSRFNFLMWVIPRAVKLLNSIAQRFNQYLQLI